MTTFAPTLQPDDELSHRVPDDTPLWCENYCFDGHDEENGLGFWLHLSQGQLHPSLWREVITLFLPDGRLGFWKGYGSAGVTANGASGPTLRCHVDEPFRRLRLEARSPLHVATPSELPSGGLADRREELCEIAVTFTAATPVWDMRRAMDGQIWASGHYEQGGRIEGTFRIGGEEMSIRGYGWRDHSLGIRNNRLMRCHVWAHAVFPSGRGFVLFQHSRRDVGEDLASGCVTTAETLVEAEVVDLTPLTTNEPGAGEAPFRFVLRTPHGTETITAEPLRTYVATSAPPSQQILGLDPTGGHIRWESQTRFTWGQESTIGLAERTMPLQP